MNRKPQNNESPLLLQLPKSVLSFSDMSGNSFLMPVAVDEVVATESSDQNATNTTSFTEASPLFQLQQPLLTRKGSADSRMSVPYSESNAQTQGNIESLQTGVVYSRAPLQESVPNLEISNRTSEPQHCPISSTVEPPPSQSSIVFSGFQNQPPTSQSDFINQSNPSSYFQDNTNFRQPNIYSQESSVPPVNNYSGDNRHLPGVFPPTIGQQSEFLDSSLSTNYSSQPPVITPTSSPLYQSNSGRNAPQMLPGSYSNFSDPQTSANMRTPEFYSRIYEPAEPYWLFLDIVETKEVWCGFSEIDSINLETAFQQDPFAVVPVDGGRYDALLKERIKKSVYFEAKDLQICRATWFYRRGTSQRFIPFPEVAADLLEQHYANCVTSGQWQKRVNVPGIGSVVMEGPQVLLYYRNDVEIWPTLPDSKTIAQPVKRGLPENFELMETENDCIDHLVFIVQGIGSFCDLRFRTVSECVDGFRDIANRLMSVHFKNELESGRVGRVEFLPLAWHAKLHTSDKGFDRCMKNITLPSIPKLRYFTNDTLLDILLYSSPTYCQTIIDTVASELNKLYEIFLSRNPKFSGSVFVAGHSLGSLILFDILSNQTSKDEIINQSNEPSDKMPSNIQQSKAVAEACDSSKVSFEKNIQESYESIDALLQACQLEEYQELFEKEKIDLSSVSLLSSDDLKDLGLPTGPRKKLLNVIHPTSEKSSDDNGDVSMLPSSITPAIAESQSILSSETEIQEFLNNEDPIGFPLKSSPCMSSIKYPRLHFEPACFFALGSPIAMFLTVRGYEFISDDFRFPTCPRFFHIFHPYDPVAFRIEPLIDPTFSAKPVLIPHHKGRKRMHLEIQENLSKVGSEIKQKVLETLRYTWDSLSTFAKAHKFSAAVEAEVNKLMEQQITETEYETSAPSETSGEEIQIGSLNGGRRIDFVLQEKPIEALNDYIFALTSHATYWDSEDTVLMFLREIYATQGILVSSPSEIKTPASEKYRDSAKIHVALSDPALYRYSQTDFQPSTSSFFNPESISNLPGRTQPTITNSAETYHGGLPSGISSSASSSNVPQFSTPAQPYNPTPFAQPVSVPPTSTAVPHVSQQPIGPPPASTSQPVGPPPLTGFVKRSPFTR